MGEDRPQTLPANVPLYYNYEIAPAARFEAHIATIAARKRYELTVPGRELDSLALRALKTPTT